MNEDPPQDGRAEDSVLGAMLIRKDAIPEVLPLLRADDFYFPNNGAIYRAIQTLFTRGDPVDSLTLKAELESHGQFIKVGGGSKILELTQLVPTAVNASHYAKIVAEKARLRAMSSLGMQLYRLAHTEGHGADELLEQAERFFSEVHAPAASGGMFKELVEGWRAWQASDAGIIPTPWPELNADIPGGGLHVGSLVVVGGRPGGGKSNAGLNIALEAAEKGHRTTVFSVEMDQYEVLSRVLAAATWSPLREIVGRSMSHETWDRVEEYVHTNVDMPLEIVDKPSISVEDIVSHCRVRKPEVVFIDYMQLLRASSDKVSREQQVAHITRALKVAAKQLKMVVIAASQLNRNNVDGKGRLPTMSDLRESGAAEQDADIVVLLHRSPNDPNVVKLITAKNRNGATRTHELVFKGAYSRVGGTHVG